jgi:uncharacterized surface protein with fasciclin (FAS1) repeats
MKNIHTLKKIALGFLFSALIISCERNSSFEDSKPSITKLVVLNSDFSILETAAIKGGVAILLTNTNASDPSGKFTVFAPTNGAFKKLGLNSDNLATLDQDFLTNTLRYAVSNGDLLSSSFLPTNLSPSAFSGNTRKFINKNGQNYINGSKILSANIAAANGTVHAIDKVLLATNGNIVESAIAVQTGKVFIKPELTYLVAAVLWADPSVLTALTTSQSLTVFAPTDEAFIKLSESLVTAGLLSAKFTQPADIQKLTKSLVTNVLLNNVVGGGKFTPELTSGANAAVGGGTLTLGAFENGVVTVKGNGNAEPAKMVIPDIQAKNGVIHIIDTVLLP